MTSGEQALAKVDMIKTREDKTLVTYRSDSGSSRIIIYKQRKNTWSVTILGGVGTQDLKAIIMRLEELKERRK